MKMAILSDIHANLQAFEACIADAEAQGATHFALLGDFVGYGANPVEVVERIQDLAQRGAYVIKGNHDVMAVHVPQNDASLGASTAAWTHATLGPAHLAFLDQLPLTLSFGSVLLVHASADNPEKWRYVVDERSADASLAAATIVVPETSVGPAQTHPAHWVFGGHVHQQTLYYKGARDGLMRFNPTSGVAIPVSRHRRWLATVGSVGQPRDGNTFAKYALFDTAQCTLNFCQVPYDFHAAAAAILKAGLPSYFAERLEIGR
jgi:diadenosine tetraphosphatase ApaH/serine/threonine PP2A family protein phosphatase